MIGMMLLPETPRFLIKQDNHDKALKSLQTLRRLPQDHPSLVAEYEEIKGNYEYELSLGNASWGECFRGTIGKRTFTGIGIQCLQQLVSPASGAFRRRNLMIVGRRQLHLLLRDILLRGPRQASQCFHPASHHQRGQRRHHFPRFMGHRPVWSSTRAAGWCTRHGCVAIHCCRLWRCDFAG